MTRSYTEATTFDFLERHAWKTPERIAFVFHDESFTYRQFHGDAMRVTYALAELGVLKGQVVIVLHQHFYLHWLLLIACENVGAISCSAASPHVLSFADYVFAESDPRRRTGRSIFIKIDRPWLDSVFSRNLASVSRHPRISNELHEPQRITHSSGTTAEPKVMLLKRGAQEAKLMDLWKSSFCFCDPRVLITLKFSVNSSFLLATLCLRLGSLAVVASLVTAIRKYRVNYFEALPLHLEKMLDGLPVNFARPMQLSIKVIGAPLTGQLRDCSLTLLCTEISGRYGTNEVWPIANDMNIEGIGNISAGVRIKIVDDSGRTLPPGQFGHIMVQSETMVDGYVNDPDDTRIHFQEGWFLTGDFGLLLPERRLQVVGRSKDILNLGGLKFSPYPLEDKIRSIRGVIEDAVSSIQSQHTIDDLCVAVVLENKMDLSRVISEIREIAPEWPNIRVKEIKVLPRTESGKLKRSAISQFFVETDQLEG